jgi:hypothetical protein
MLEQNLGAGFVRRRFEAGDLDRTGDAQPVLIGVTPNVRVLLEIGIFSSMPGDVSMAW